VLGAVQAGGRQGSFDLAVRPVSNSAANRAIAVISASPRQLTLPAARVIASEGLG
jgi:hypothetical protein